MSEQECEDIELITAIEGLIDNELSDEQFVKLQKLMMNDSGARATVARQLTTHALLTTHFAEKGNAQPALITISGLGFAPGMISPSDLHPSS
jgi:hypothetical protein